MLHRIDRAHPGAAQTRSHVARLVLYEYFIRPEAIVRWMGDYALLEPEVGGQFTLDVRGAPVRGRYLALEPPNRLFISWG